jgi:hypothetical protein
MGGKGNFKDLVGQKFNFLTVIGRSDKRDKGSHRVYWLCKCDCGNTTEVATTYLKNGRIKSCGCLKKYKSQTLLRDYMKDYSKELRLTHGENYPEQNELYKAYRNSARRRKIEFKLSKSDFFSFLDKPCYYCGREKSNKHKVRNKEEYYEYNGIDRIDPNKGYVLENCVTCCVQCNYSKRDMLVEEWFEFVKRLSSSEWFAQYKEDNNLC